MASESDRMARAGDYVLGLMNDSERERAERDLEIDPAFRDAVVQLAERMHVFDRARPADERDRWNQITARIAELPQMRASGLDDGKPVIRGLARPPYGMGLQALGGQRGLVVAVGLIAAFVLGYISGRL
ncbi:MAG: hypothetical protein ABIQ51_01555 [Mesorhizobium sp.]